MTWGVPLWYPIILPFHIVHGVLKARILKWLAIPFSSGPRSVRPLRWPKYWSFSFSISPSNKYSQLVFFRIDWFDLLAIQMILKSILQYHSLKASILWHSAFFMVQFSHPYITSGN